MRPPRHFQSHTHVLIQMNKTINNALAIVILLLSAALSVAAEPIKRPVNGVYTGWEPLPKMKGQGGSDWFRLHRITIQDAVVSLSGRPVAVKGTEMLHSASEGGFLNYNGRFYEKEGKLRIKFTHVEKDEDYGGRLDKDDLEIRGIDLVRFEIGGIVYTLQDRPESTKD